MFRKETTRILYGGTIFSLLAAFGYTSVVTLMMALVFLPYTATGGILTPRKVFSTLFLFTILAKFSIYFVVKCLFYTSEARVALRRIKVVKVHI